MKIFFVDYSKPPSLVDGGFLFFIYKNKKNMKDFYKFLLKNWGKSLFILPFLILVFLGLGVRDYIVYGELVGVIISNSLLVGYFIIFYSYYLVSKKKK